MLPVWVFCRLRVSELFQVFRSALVGDAAGDVPHTAANLHGVGGDDSSYFGGKVAQNDFAFIVPTGIEAEGAEVNPGAASHLLVYLELRGAAFVIDGVKGIVRAVWQGLVRDVYGVLSGRRDFGNPFGGACVSFLDGFYSAVSASLKGFSKSMYWGRRWAKLVLLPGSRACHRNFLYRRNGRVRQPSLSTMTSAVWQSRSRGSSTLAPAFSSIGTRKGNT